MTDEQTMPDWVLIEAAKRGEWSKLLTIEDLRHQYIGYNNPMFSALCDMILKHEQPPADRKLLCAREAMARNVMVRTNSSEYRSGIMDDGPAVQDCLRAIELWEEGFGK